jgi:hypothetical protein
LFRNDRPEIELGFVAARQTGSAKKSHFKGLICFDFHVIVLLPIDLVTLEVFSAIVTSNKREFLKKVKSVTLTMEIKVLKPGLQGNKM